MGKNKANPDEQKQPQSRELIFTPEDKKKLVDFFSILIEIDRKTNITGVYDKPTN